jgi:hypothetical protein
MDWKEQLKAFVEANAPRNKGWQRMPRPDNTPEQIAALGETLTPEQQKFFEEHERMHEEMRKRIGLDKLSAEQVVDLIINEEIKK